MPAQHPALPVASAEGVRITLADGRELIDGMASWWCAIHGYRHPVLDAAAREQLGRMAHVMFGGLTHEPAVRLAERLVALTPDPLEHVFFADSGSVAVEVAMKMCRQARPGRTTFLTVRGGYHGDTLSCMSVCDPVGGMHALFAGSVEQHVFADRPPVTLDDAYAAHLESLVTDELCAVIVEPVVQGAGGMWFYDPAVLRVLRDLCDAHGLLLVFDEIATGFGRTGALFACEHAGVVPDVMCVGKALTAGYLTLAATLCTPDVAGSLAGGALMHGPTYMANPLACAVALASLDLLDWERDVPRIEAGLRAGLDGVAGARVKGAIGVIELDHPVDVAAASAAAIERGVWLRPFRNLVYAMPPYVTGDEDLARVCEAMRAAAAAG
ncbi:MAG: adenosylmethionine---8-amino-7-oxononanoate aminotransferase [Solirubrobacteraceae bacterium]|jgi:adenosylmethionine-8-amino-7-oxononanoate aminotransferase|nr:adenosylmethionine---8-amino-7-oxononanoate aminotransferase [Solirubrobacteraceae bacterium]